MTASQFADHLDLRVRVNGVDRQLEGVDARVTLLDLLREHLDLTGAKKGCNHGECGACTILLDGRRANGCLILAAAADEREVVSVEGLASGEQLHAVRRAFIDHDAFQCGFCTPGQVISAALPVNADIPSDIDIAFIDEVDEHASPIGGEGIGELGATGVDAAVADAVFHATGRRIRELPITPDRLVSHVVPP